MIGYLGLSTGKGFVEAAIRFFTNGLDSHSFIMIGKIGLDEACIEAPGLMTRAVSFRRNYLEGNDTWEVWAVHAPEDDRRRAATAIFYKYTDRWYAYLSYVWYVVWFLMVKLGFKRPSRMPRLLTPGIHCSELCALYLLELGGEYAEALAGRDPNVITPADLREIMRGNPKLFTCMASDSDHLSLDTRCCGPGTFDHAP
jgi:hypothetical protein